MGEIVKLPRRNAALPPLAREVGIALSSAEQSMRLLGRDATRLIQNLEESLGNIRACISALPDAGVSSGLAADHAELSSALAEAKTVLASLGFDRTDDAVTTATDGGGTRLRGTVRF